jgi:beta-galactosidase
LSQFQVNGAVSVNDGGWHHIAGVYDGSALRLYVDGVLDASVSSTGSISTNAYNVEIGRNAEQSGREFHGAIYDARIYNRALCPEEIQELFDGGGVQGVRIIKWVELQ